MREPPGTEGKRAAAVTSRPEHGETEIKLATERTISLVFARLVEMEVWRGVWVCVCVWDLGFFPSLAGVTVPDKRDGEIIPSD